MTRHKAEFNVIEPQYRLAHIFVSTQPNQQVRNLKNDKAKNEAEARTKIQMIMNRLDSGEDFASVAMNWSERPGDLEQWRRSGLHPRIGARANRSGYACGIGQAQARTVQRHHQRVSIRIPTRYSDIRIVRLRGQGTSRPARVERSAGAAAHSGTASGPPGATTQVRVLRRDPRSGEGGKLLRRTGSAKTATRTSLATCSLLKRTGSLPPRG